MKKINTHAPAMTLCRKPAARALALAGALSLPLPAWAQAVPIDFEAEGVVTDIYAHPDGSAVDLTVFGRVMRVPLGATIHTPSATLTLEQLADPTPFPGRGAIPGFLGGTAILIGEVVTDADGVAQPLIKDVAIEPAETVLLGSVTANESGAIRVMGVPLVMSADARMPSEGVHNEYGFAVIPETIPVGVLAAVEGYFAPDGNFYHFLIEAGGGDLVDPSTPQSSILRARCVPGGRLEVQGSSYLPAANTVDFYNATTGFNFGSITTTIDPLEPAFGSYRYRVDVNDAEVDSDGACPSQVRAVTRTNSTEAVATVDGVVAPAAVVTPGTGTNEPPVAVDDLEPVFVGLGTEVHVTLNDTDPNGNLDVTTIQLTNVPPELLVQDLDTGDLQVTASAAGTYSFNYTVADTEGLISNVATVVIQAQPVAMDTVDITRANYRTDKDRWEARGTSNQAGSVVTVTLVRTNQVLATVTADATGAWQLDARNTGITAIAGDVVRASSNGGGSDELAVTISR